MTRAEEVRAAAALFREAGCDTPEFDARALAAEAFALSPAELIAGGPDEAGPEERVRLDEMIARRVAGEPVARIIGHREFWGLRFRLAPETLVPRPDSETIVETALAEAGARDRALSVLDLGAGTGCLLLAILSERPHAVGVGIDLSPAAAAAAQANAAALGLQARALFVAGSWGEAIGRRFDVVVSNPPYIARPDIAHLDVEVRAHDPHLALDGGLDGLRAYRALALGLEALLKADGVAVLELGAGQAEEVSELMRAAGLAVPRVVPDLAGTPRALVVRRRR
ncbi:peptide chain release factor N(5)-glutamine methyltransferase [Chenggangzhangella methanolivorans]|uniref:Release factor glutamine methyltransferase n=1 Tax=Chenggangzhangella methanolivorans TaxID=1437009 RepID=A0A9E6UP42_9HYPH|nr:peptide chain release factor N(5)-glutamine methyltransferase [Chenggangzhangella methanolivorans]QZO01861.1 peptide chain release factor N(5)-glutamine methyltransferase [Chenggangzhangella methanolivorans]